MSVRSIVTLVIACACWVIATASVRNVNVVDDVDYLDDLREYSAHHADDASAKYTARLNKIDMFDDYPHDDEYHDGRYDDEDEDDYDDYEDDDDDDDEDEEERDEEGGGCGGGDDDEDPTMNSVQEVIEEFFTR